MGPSIAEEETGRRGNVGARNPQRARVGVEEVETELITRRPGAGMESSGDGAGAAASVKDSSEGRGRGQRLQKSRSHDVETAASEKT